MDELKELREKQAVDTEDVAIEGFDGQAQVSTSQREKTMRLEIENSRLKAELEKLKGGATKDDAAAAVSQEIMDASQAS